MHTTNDGHTFIIKHISAVTPTIERIGNGWAFRIYFVDSSLLLTNTSEALANAERAAIIAKILAET